MISKADSVPTLTTHIQKLVELGLYLMGSALALACCEALGSFWGMDGVSYHVIVNYEDWHNGSVICLTNLEF